ncbi:MAG: alpha-D-ribose 1-methylphosphonate 5-triphosphate diphosphatase [Alphaproteobacteria bacterium]|nr:alpha-D-ribose 1-methylphosphonate 5-triphosphate diphosphatase [Alphaproteobacteria bacterium]|tara:strand:+ start:69 stop:1214 length:1146 start_codon:yes stop_codon:yes gene_type:complete
MNAITLANAHIVGEFDEFVGLISFDEDRIINIDRTDAVPSGAIDCGGDIVCPGLIELHTDNLERHIQPRPGVFWSSEAAVAAHDRELASAGVTTVFDALRVGSVPSDENSTGYRKYARDTANKILSMVNSGDMKINHYIHLRAELCTETLPDELAEFSSSDRVGLVSLMDHTPGQRQFRDVEKLREYLRGKHGFSESKIDQHFAERIELQTLYGDKHRDLAIKFSEDVNAVLASHDDTTVGDVEASAAAGVRLAEFPTTIEAAESCRQFNQSIIMGAPNIVRGQSHSGNVAAEDCGKAGLLDILSSDYIPASLLLGAVKLGYALGDFKKGIQSVTSAPADAVGLDDRGRLKVGSRADIVRFRLRDNLPVVGSVYCGGKQVA